MLILTEVVERELQIERGYYSHLKNRGMVGSGQ
jgi:hypothetical protein